MNTPLRTCLLAVSIPGTLLQLTQTATAQNTEIRIFCSNGIRAAMEKLLPQDERITGRRINVEYGASANFKRSIEAGAPFDLAILTPQLIDDLIKEGKIAAGTEVQIASTGIGIAVRAGAPKPDVATGEAIKQLLLGSKSIGYVQVGAGTPAILDMLNHLGLQEALQSKTVFQPGAAESMKNLASGQVDVALALISEILPAPGVQLAGPLPSQFQRAVTMAAGIASSTEDREAVEKIIHGLTSVEAESIIKAAGLDPIKVKK